MLYVAIFDAKEDATLEEINREREEWLKLGKDQTLKGKCAILDRYEVAGQTPMRIFFLIETDDPGALNIISHHFGDYWNSVTYPVIKRGIFEALEEDRTVTCG